MAPLNRAPSFFDPAILSAPQDYLRDLRLNTPVAKVVDGIGREIYLVTSAELVQEATRRHHEFSSLTTHLTLAGGGYPEMAQYFEQCPLRPGLMVNNDDPDHAKYRAIVNSIFASGSVARLASKIEALVDELIDGFAAAGECDFFEAFAVPLPLYVICDILGIERDALPDVKRWSDAAFFLGSRMGTSKEQDIQAAKELVNYRRFLLETVAARRAAPRDDLVSDLIAADPSKRTALSDSEIASLCFEVASAGNDTTRQTLASGMVLLLQNPEQLQRLRERPELIPNAVEEILRLQGALSGQWRVTTADIELGGVTIPQGAAVLLRLDEANRDEKVFSNPRMFDVARPNAHEHMAFGARGIHRCLGQMLARKELEVSFRRLLIRLPNLRLIPAKSDTSHQPRLRHRGIRGLWIAFDCGERVKGVQ